MTSQVPSKVNFSLRIRVQLTRGLPSFAEQTLPKIILTHQLTTRLCARKELLDRCTLHLFGVSGFDGHVSNWSGSRSARFLLSPILFAGLNVRQSASDGDFVDTLLHSVADEVHPYGRLAGLTDTVDTRDGLQLDGCLNERLADEDMRGVNQGQA
jgi:hypothetical protein